MSSDATTNTARTSMFFRKLKFVFDKNITSDSSLALFYSPKSLITFQDAAFYTELEFLNCDLLVRQLKGLQSSYSKSVIEVRRLESAAKKSKNRQRNERFESA